jgi:diaminopimelate decarboxylase
MNDFIRPALYQAVHKILPIEMRNRKTICANIAGPVCESGDFLGLARTLEQPHPGDILAVFNAGAYGFSMSSNYNSRPRPAEVLVSDGQVDLIRRRETYDDLLATQTF